ncbi:redox-sensing transcriptional repressor Rex [Frankia sp. Ag45/Mut15]|uniref:Redox-sensing transcriptional repressor Rex n=1 Tax=Frankia umida TaxID=573489 RepID=A0ABT0JT57_9ACTN|nr:redox-sensing transcriptional repressor Rex [Frankia umida]MCK9874757.1 redox-sensing transcriptional repressor Rex [Frankia umida]
MSQPRRRPAVIRRRARSEPAANRSSVPEATVARLPLYLRVLTTMADHGVHTVSSDTLAAATGVTSAKVRKDLSYLGSYGTRGVGYEVDVLLDCIATRLGLTEDRSVLLVGVGNLGHALAGYGGFHARGFRIVALVDADPDRVGERVGEVVVRPVDELEQVIAECAVTIGVICTPAAAAQRVCDRLVAVGVTSILNFAPTVLMVPEGVDVRKVDLAVELQILSFHEARKRPAASAADGSSSPAPPVRTGKAADSATTVSARGALEVHSGARARPRRLAGAVGEPRPGLATTPTAEPPVADRDRLGDPPPTTAARGVNSRPDRVTSETDGVVRVTRQAGQARPAQVVHEIGPSWSGQPGWPGQPGWSGQPTPPVLPRGVVAAPPMFAARPSASGGPGGEWA